MPLTPAQLNAIVGSAVAGEQLKGARQLADGRYGLLLASGERLDLHVYATADAAATAGAALRLLRGEVDLPVPQLRAADETGATVGQPYIITSEAAGEPLAQAVARIPGEALYSIGRRLGEVVSRMHRLATGRYGALAGADAAQATDERAYMLSRVARDLARCHTLGLLDRVTGAAVQRWFAEEFQPASTRAALLHANLMPETIFVRPTKDGWRLSALLGWEHACGWVPAWEHVALLDAASDARYFGLRVGYGNGYDEQTPRPNEQVRERLLTPYRLLLALERLPERHERGQVAQARYYRNLALSMLRLLTDDEAADAAA